MSSLIHVGNYEECYNLSSRQLKSLESIDSNNQFLINSSKKFIMLSMLGLEKYNEIINNYLADENLSLTKNICLMLALYKKGFDLKDLSEYKKFYNELQVEDLNEKYYAILSLVNQFLNCKKKTLLNKLLDYEIMSHFEKIIKKL